MAENTNQLEHPADMKVKQRAVDLDEKRRAALERIDNAKFGWFHVRTVAVAGIGFFTDAYDLFAVNLVTYMLGYVYFADHGNKVPSNIDMGLKVSASVGTVVGQLLFGWLADNVGRKRMYGVELMIIIVATVGASLAANAYAVSTQGVIMFWRVLLGIGIGGDYPLSAVITSEFASTKTRGAMMAAVFGMQGFGILFAGIVSLITLSAFKSSIEEDVTNIDYVWRIVFGVGAIPGLVALYFRLTIPETPRYTMDIDRDVNQASTDINNVLESGTFTARDPDAAVNRAEAPKSSWADFTGYFGKWENGKVLLGTAVTWFALDVAFYGLGLNNSIILDAIGYSGGSDAYKSLYNAIVGNLIITVMGTVPGYWFTVGLVDRWGRKPIQLMGFGILTVLFIVLGAAFHEIKTHAIAVFIVLFTLAQFFQNFGPNATTFIVPGEVFPTRYRSTGHGISAASGKLGSILAVVVFGALKDRGGKNAFVPELLLIFAGFMFMGFVFTFLIPETKGRSLEELSNENQNDFVKDNKKQ